MFFGLALGAVFSAVGAISKGASGASQASSEAAANEANARRAEGDADITERQTEIQLARQGRETFKGLGGIRAAAGQSGVKQSGSVLDILQSSAAEAALDKSIIGTQGTLASRGFTAEAEQSRSLAGGAKKKGIGSIIGGIAGAATSLLG